MGRVSTKPATPLRAGAAAVRPTRRHRMSEDVAEQITELVIADGLQPGDRLPTEPELVDMFDVSRTVVREAGRLLVERGLVDIRPGRGMVVADFDGAGISRQYQLMLELQQGSFTQLMEMRIVLEVGMTGFAADRRTNDDLTAIDAALDAFSIAKGDQLAAVEADLAFHSAVAAAAHNPFFMYVVNPINDYLRQTYRHSLGYDSAQAQTHAEHTQITAAIRAGDSELARLRAREHLTRIISDSDQLADAQNPIESPAEQTDKGRGND